MKRIVLGLEYAGDAFCGWQSQAHGRTVQDVLEMATTEAAHRRILTALANPEQHAIVAAPLEGNHLVLAGPGAGKTRVIVHRVAWLLRESMVPPDAVMVLAYNRAAANEIRRRL